MKSNSQKKTFIILNLSSLKKVSGGLSYETTISSPDGTITKTRGEITIETPIGTVK